MDKADSLLRVAQAWNKSSGDLQATQRYGLYYWVKVFNSSTIDEFKYYLRNLGNGAVLPALQKLTGKSPAEITEWLKE